MSLLDKQTLERTQQIFKNGIGFQEAAAGVKIQRVPGSYLYRILRPLLEARDYARSTGRNEREGEAAASRVNPNNHIPDDEDPVVHAIYNLDTIFARCSSMDVDMLASAEAIAKEWKERGTASQSCLLLAWKTVFNSAEKKVQKPKLVGAMTLHKFVVSVNFSTDYLGGGRGSLSERDHAILHGRPDARSGAHPIRNYFNRQTMYIDAMCAIDKSGVGRLLVLNAIRWAIMRKCTGVIALSYSPTQKTKPESFPLFESMHFDKIIPEAKFNTKLYGTWFFKPLDKLGLADLLLKEGLDICTRPGLTRKTEDVLMWRCPN